MYLRFKITTSALVAEKKQDRQQTVGFYLGKGHMTDMYLSRAHYNSRGSPPHRPTWITLT